MLRKIQAPIQVASEAVSRMSHLARELWDLVVALPYRVDLSVQTQDGSHHSDTNALVISNELFSGLCERSEADAQKIDVIFVVGVE